MCNTALDWEQKGKKLTMKNLKTFRMSEKFVLYQTASLSDTWQTWIYLNVVSLILSTPAPLTNLPSNMAVTFCSDKFYVWAPAHNGSKLIQNDAINKSATFLVQLTCVNNSVDTLASLLLIYGDFSSKWQWHFSVTLSRLLAPPDHRQTPYI